MFKGTEKTGAEEFSRIIAQNGGNENAFTSHDYTAYFENIELRTASAIPIDARIGQDARPRPPGRGLQAGAVRRHGGAADED